MSCPECGQPVGETGPFCPKCYARIEPPCLWQRLLSLSQPRRKPGVPVLNIKKGVAFNLVDKDGTRREYHSLNEVPRIFARRSNALKSKWIEAFEAALVLL